MLRQMYADSYPGTNSSMGLLSNTESHRKPRNARSKRALEKRAPKAVENPKTALFLRGTSCSQIVRFPVKTDD